MHNRNIFDNFRNAFMGIYYAFRTQRNIRFQTAAAIAVIIIASILDVTPWEWLAIIFAITLVISCELINTAIEAVVDMYTTSFHPLAKVAKDVAAGAVIICALCSVVIGIIVFLPYINKFLH